MLPAPALSLPMAATPLAQQIPHDLAQVVGVELKMQAVRACLTMTASTGISSVWRNSLISARPLGHRRQPD